MESEWSVDRSPGTATVVVRGEIDPSLSATLVAQALAGLDDIADGAPVVLDLRAVDFIDSSGLGALIRVQRTCLERSAELVVLPSPAVTRLLELCDLLDLFTLRDELSGGRDG
jgi:anti-sigma B factor antagonist